MIINIKGKYNQLIYNEMDVIYIPKDLTLSSNCSITNSHKNLERTQKHNMILQFQKTKVYSI